MLIAQQKRKENIAEYLLYLWQVEDMLRACDLDMDRVEAALVSRYDVDDAKRHEIRDWYENLVMMMRAEHLRDGGHLQICKNVLIRLNDLHSQLLHESDRFAQYSAAFYSALPFIVELRAKAGDAAAPELETCFNLLYGVMMLRLQGKSVSESTQKAVTTVSYFIGMLAAYFKKDEEKPLFEPDTDE